MPAVSQLQWKYINGSKQVQNVILPFPCWLVCMSETVRQFPGKPLQEILTDLHYCTCNGNQYSPAAREKDKRCSLLCVCVWGGGGGGGEELS